MISDKPLKDVAVYRPLDSAEAVSRYDTLGEQDTIAVPDHVIVVAFNAGK